MTRGWRSALTGAGVATLALAAIVAVLGPALTVIPIETLRLVVGGLLLVFGLQWLRKAILRASGWKARSRRGVRLRTRARGSRKRAARGTRGARLVWLHDRFKAVLLEGLEVAFIVLTFGSTQGSIPLAIVGAAAAVIIVVLAGILVREPLSRVPENTLEFAVGVMLTTFGIFWGAEGAGVDWPGGDAALPAVLGFVLLVSLGYVTMLRRRRLVFA